MYNQNGTQSLRLRKKFYTLFFTSRRFCSMNDDARTQKPRLKYEIDINLYYVLHNEQKNFKEPSKSLKSLTFKVFKGFFLKPKNLGFFSNDLSSGECQWQSWSSSCTDSLSS